MEEGGRIRRGLFVGGLGAMQFALPAALDLLRSVRDEPDSVAGRAPGRHRPRQSVRGAARVADAARRGRETPRADALGGSTVILVNGRLAAYLARGDRQLSVYLPEAEPTRTNTARAVASRLFPLATASDARRGMLVAHIDGVPVAAPACALSDRSGIREGSDGVSGAQERRRYGRMTAPRISLQSSVFSFQIGTG